MVSQTKEYSILLKVVEPLIPRGPGEVDPGVRGPHAHGIPLPMPNTTSILGVLLTGYISKGGKFVGKAKNVEEWYKDFEATLGLGEGEGAVRGPFIYCLNGNQEILLVATFEGWVTIDKLYDRLSIILDLINIGEEHKVSEYLRELTEIYHEDVLEDRVIISLEDVTKRVRPHYFTLLKLIDYEKILDKLTVKKHIQSEVYLGIELHKDKFENIINTLKPPLPVRAFGRSRISTINIHREAILMKFLREKMEKIDKVIGNNTILLYNISPILLHIGETKDEYLKEELTVVPGLKELYEYIRGEISKLCKCKKESCVEDLKIYGRVITIGLGYSIRFHERKPLYNALSPGTIIYAKVRKCNATPLEVYKEGIGELGHLGFGTIIPLVK